MSMQYVVGKAFLEPACDAQPIGYTKQTHIDGLTGKQSTAAARGAGVAVVVVKKKYQSDWPASL